MSKFGAVRLRDETGTNHADPDSDGNLPVSIDAPISIGNISNSAFGEQSVVQPRPFIQSTFSYNLIPSNFREISTGTGTTGAADRMAFTSTGTTSGGYAAIQSFRGLNYKAGEGGKARFTAVFDSAVADSWQGIGLVNLGDELSFGYNGVDFGVWHRRNGIAEVQTLTITGAAGGSENATLTLDGTGYTVALTSGAVEHNCYEVAKYINDSIAEWDADQLDDTVIISAASDGAKSGSYSFTSSSATGTIAQTQAGATKTSTHIAEADWNGESFTFDPSNGNVYQIRFQYLGFGNIFFDMEDPVTGKFKTVHTILFCNTSTTPSLGNPSLKFGMYGVSLGSTTDLVLHCASCALFVEGFEAKTRNPRAVENNQSIGTTFTNILSLRNRRTYNGFINQVEIEPYFMTLANDAAKPAEFTLCSGVDPGVELDYENVGTDLVSDVATDSITGMSGRVLAAFAVGRQSSLEIDLELLRIRIPPSLQLWIEGRVVSGASSDLSASITYYEDV